MPRWNFSSLARSGVWFGRGFLELEYILLYSEEMEKNLLWHAQATSTDKFMCIYVCIRMYAHVCIYMYTYIGIHTPTPHL